MSTIIPITKGYEAIVDDAYGDYFRQYTWSSLNGGVNNTNPCAIATSGELVGCLMHHCILNAPPGFVIIHLNYNNLDNRVQNLRVVDWSTALHRKTTTPRPHAYRGVVKSKNSQYWRAAVSYKGKLHYQDRFTSPLDAARAYDDMAYQLYGEYAMLNFPKG